METRSDTDEKMSTIEIDPHGDVILEVGEFGTSLIASSKVLSLVSPVLDAMFKNHFKEGLQLQKVSEKPFPIPLPEDDAEAFTLFAKVIHHRTQEIPEKPNVTCLEKLAFVCDKYQCTEVFANCGSLWLQKLIKGVTETDLYKLLFFAYVIDLPEPFSAVSWEIMQLQVGPFVHLPVLTNNPLVHHDILSEFNTRKIEVASNLHKALMKPISQTAEFNCDESHKAAGEYLYKLKISGFLPHEERFEQHSYTTIVTEALEFDRVLFGQCQKSYCGCYKLRGMNLMEELRQEIERFRNLKIGICLDCAKTGRRSKTEGRCRICHH